MAVFTAAATALLGAFGVAGTILGSATLFNLAVGVIATGLAAGTAKLFGVFDPPGSPQDPGVKIQLAPATDNKVAKMYGRNYAGGIITDAEIKNQNKTMAYCIVLSEYTAGETWTVNDVFRGDARLLFSGATVTGQIDPNSTSNTKINGKMRCRVYAGGSEAVNQIFPATDAQPAYNSSPSSKSGQFVNWTSANTMEDLVFAVFELDYDPENGLTGLGAITFDLENSQSNPSLVLQDYLLNTRYGPGLTSADLDQSTFDDWETYCDEQVDYITINDLTAQHERYRIDGALSMFNTCKKNISEICLNGGAFFTYNGKTGKFGVVVNRAATALEQSNAFQFNDDNIVSGISITSTELFNLYNKVEVEYPSFNQKDQTDVYFAEVGNDIRNPNEPDNILNFRLNMVNDRSRVSQIANIDLNQSRISTVVEFTADHSALQVDVGDVVKLTSDLYGFNQKLFRCMRLTEVEDSEGSLSVKVVLLEYDDDVYGDIITKEDLPVNDTGISNWWNLKANSSITAEDYIFVVNDPSATNIPRYFIDTGSASGLVSSATIRQNVIFPTSGGGVKKPYARVDVRGDNGVFFDTYEITVLPLTESNVAVSAGTRYVYKNTDGEDFGVLLTGLGIPLEGTGSNFLEEENVERMKLTIKGYDSVSGLRTLPYESANIPVSAFNFVTKEDLNTFAAGSQFDGSPANKTDLASGTTFVDLMTSETYSLVGVDYGSYTVYAQATPLGSATSIYDLGFKMVFYVQYRRGIGDSIFRTYTADILKSNIPTTTDIPDVFLAKDFVIDPEAFGYDPDYKPYNLQITLQGYSTLALNGSGQRGFANMYYQVLKITKGGG